MNEIIIIQNMVNNKENNKGGFCEQAQNRYIFFCRGNIDKKTTWRK